MIKKKYQSQILIEEAKKIEQTRIKNLIAEYEESAQEERLKVFGKEKAERAYYSITHMVADRLTALLKDTNLNNADIPHIKFLPGNDALVMEIFFPGTKSKLPDFMARNTLSALAKDYDGYAENVKAVNEILRFDRTLNFHDRQNLELIIDKINTLHTI